MLRINKSSVENILNRNTYFLILLVLFQLSFNFDTFNIAGKDWFQRHQKSSEALVTCKMTDNEIFNSRALCRCNEKTFNSTYLDKNISDKTIFEENYKSSFGFQAYFYASIDRFLNIFTASPKNKIDVLYFITSFLLAILLSVFLCFIKKEFGIIVSVLLFIMLLLAPWLIVFSRNLYWMFFLIIYPFLFIWIQLKQIEENRSSFKKMYYVLFLLVLLKSLSGFEYLSTIFISILVPIVYFFIKKSWSKKFFLKVVLKTYIAAFIGFFTSVFLFLIQKTVFFNSFSDALKNFMTIILKRTTSLDTSKYDNLKVTIDQVFVQSLNSTIGEVINKYLGSNLFEIFNFIITPFYLINLLILITIVALVGLYKNYFKKELKKEIKALVISTWLSLLAPLSWFILAKGHSYIHPHMNHVLWYIPFVPMAIILIVYVIINIDFKSKLLLVILYFILSFSFFHINKLIERNQFNSNIDIVKLSSTDDFEIYVNLDEYKLILSTSSYFNNLENRFFLHLYTTNNEHGFKNLDFSWDNINHGFNNFYFSSNHTRIKKYSFKYLDFNWNNTNIKEIKLKGIPIDSIHIGQFNSNGRLWEKHIPFLNNKHIISRLKKNEELLKKLIPSNISDNNWTHGINNKRNAFTVNKPILSLILKKGLNLKFSSDSIHKIEKIKYHGEYINIYLDKPCKLDFTIDGYPNNIKILF